MNGQTDPADAARALSEIGRQREQVIRRAAVPGWFWWANAVLVIALAAAVGSRPGVVLWTGIALFAVASLALNVPLARAARAAPPRRGLASPGHAPGLLVRMAAFAVILIGVMLATGLGLKAAGVPYPGTIAATVTAVVYAAGWQLLMRYETAILLRRSRSQG